MILKNVKIKNMAKSVGMEFQSWNEKADSLDRQAEALEWEADRLEGTCWEGNMSPSQARRMEASDKRQHAMLLRLHMNK